VGDSRERWSKDVLRGGTLSTIEQFTVGKVLQSGRKAELTLAMAKKAAQAVVAWVQRSWQTGTPPEKVKVSVTELESNVHLKEDDILELVLLHSGK